MKNIKQQAGFTLVEIMAVVVIIGIIAAIAIPAYQDSVKKSRRIDAQSSLISFASALERHYAVKNTYIGVDNGGDAKGRIPDASIFANETPLEGAVKYYDLRITFTALAYTVFAIPKGAQAGDGSLRLTSTNARGWDKANNGTYSEGW